MSPASEIIKNSQSKNDCEFFVRKSFNWLVKVSAIRYNKAIEKTTIEKEQTLWEHI